MKAKLMKLFPQSALLALFSLATIVFVANAWHGNIKAKGTCDTASAEMDPADWPDGIKSHTINGVETWELEVPWNGATSIKFSGKIVWENGEKWSGSDTANRPSGCDPTKVPTQQPTTQPTPITPTDTPEPTATPTAAPTVPVPPTEQPTEPPKEKEREEKESEVEARKVVCFTDEVIVWKGAQFFYIMPVSVEDGVFTYERAIRIPIPMLGFNPDPVFGIFKDGCEVVFSFLITHEVLEDLYKMPVYGGPMANLTSSPDLGETEPATSVTNEVFFTSREMFGPARTTEVITRSGADRRTVVRDCHTPTISPDGTLVLCEDEASPVILHAEGEFTPLSVLATGFSIQGTGLEWRPDSAAVAYQSEEDYMSFSFTYQVGDDYTEFTFDEAKPEMLYEDASALAYRPAGGWAAVVVESDLVVVMLDDDGMVTGDPIRVITPYPDSLEGARPEWWSPERLSPDMAVDATLQSLEPTTSEAAAPVCPSYEGDSVIDCLVLAGQDASSEARAMMAFNYRLVDAVDEFTGTADQNTDLLEVLRGK